jgi:hypothetical protein
MKEKKMKNENPMNAKHLFQVIAMILAFSNPIYTSAQTLESDDIRKSFNDYKAAILASDGDKAVTYVDQNTIEYYNGILENTLKSDSLTISNLEMIDRVVILMVRQSTTTNELESMDGNALFVYAVDNGLVGKNSVQNNTIGTVEVNEDSAKATLNMNGKSTETAFNYHLEDGVWKIDLTSIFPEAEIALKSLVKSSGKSENEYIMMVIQFVTNEKPKPNIWQPLVN